jgi:predicted enzyme related to lactoylglutathione lyase
VKAKKCILNKNQKILRIIGAGGIFFKCKNPDAQNEWYAKHFGMSMGPNGANFERRQSGQPDKKRFMAWSPMSIETDYFGEGSQQYLISYRVENLEELVTQLKKEGITIVNDIESYDYGKFVHIPEGEGNRVELWEPNDVGYEKMGEAITK